MYCLRVRPVARDSCRLYRKASREKDTLDRRLLAGHNRGRPSYGRNVVQKDLMRRANQNAELPEVDQNFMRSLEAGLPDCAGVSIGLDRVLMILAEPNSLDAVMPIGREPHL